MLCEHLRELREAGLVEQVGGEAYALADLGASLGSSLEPLGAWARAWAARTGAG